MKHTLEALKGRIDVQVTLKFDPELDALYAHASKGNMHQERLFPILELTNARDPEYSDRCVASLIEEMP